MKTIIIDGRIGKDGAKVMKTQGGKSYLRFSLANDSFVNGANKTEWFDVTCFDQFIVENRVKFLQKGRYVIVNGTLNSEVAVKDGKVYLNQYVNAIGIDFPSFGTKKEEGSEVSVSTYTGGTKSAEVIPEAKVETHAPKAEEPERQVEVKKPQPQVSVSAASASGWADGDDLPF